MQKFLEQFKNLNTRDPGAWPPVPKAMLLLGVLIGIVALGYFLDWQEEMESLEAGRVQEAKLKDEYVAKQQQAINLDLYRQQLREIDSSFGALLKQLPAETKREFYAELPVTLKLNGSYHDMGQFASDIGQLSRIVTLNDIALTAAKEGAAQSRAAKGVKAGKK